MKRNKKKILVTGGCGYVGTVLVPFLLNNNYKVTVIDTMWFGNKLKKNKDLKIIKSDISQIDKINLKGYYAVIHLANIANDPSALLDPRLTWEVNVLNTKKLVEQSIKNNIKKFIFASSGSVYGIKKEKKVTEDLDLVPISDYNKTKMIAEQILMTYKKKIKIFCIRPATVCGYSENMRLDISLNLLTYQALSNKMIKIFGGQQIRPNIHIKDLCSVFLFFLIKNISSGHYNAGFENIKILDLAKKIQKLTKTRIKIFKNNNDPRSYRQDSIKILKIGFKRKFGVDYAIRELIEKYKNNFLKKTDNFFRVNYMKKNKIKF